jgi:hypothetical protein
VGGEDVYTSCEDEGGEEEEDPALALSEGPEGQGAGPSVANPSALRLNDIEGLTTPTDPLLGGGEAVDIYHSMSQDGESTDDGGCLDNLPEMAMSSCVWVGSNLLSRMLFQIYKEIGDESKISTRAFNHFPGCKLHLASRLLTNDMANSLHDFLPETARIENPLMAFATYRDGWSMENLLAKTRDKSPLVILVRTLKHRYIAAAPYRIMLFSPECYTSSCSFFIISYDCTLLILPPLRGAASSSAPSPLARSPRPRGTCAATARCSCSACRPPRPSTDGSGCHPRLARRVMIAHAV